MRFVLSPLFLCFVCIVGFTSCVSKQNYQYLRAEYDSIAMVNLMYQDQAYETDSLVASVIAGFQELNNVEMMINVNALRREHPRGVQKRVQRNVMLLSEKLEQSNRSIELLIQRIEGSGRSSMRLQGTILRLKEQLQVQQERVANITEETTAKIKNINALERFVSKLKNEAEKIQHNQQAEYERLKLLEDSLNVVYYAMGTRDDFREMSLLSKEGRVSIDNAELSYLTQKDKREFSEVDMMSKTARLLTIHPRSSYRLTPDKKGYLKLEILDPKGFWEYSQIMLVEVDF